MAEQLPKYRYIFDDVHTLFDRQINTAASEGYEVVSHSVNTAQVKGTESERIAVYHSAIMRLATDSGEQAQAERTELDDRLFHVEHNVKADLDRIFERLVKLEDADRAKQRALIVQTDVNKAAQVRIDNLEARLDGQDRAGSALLAHHEQLGTVQASPVELSAEVQRLAENEKRNYRAISDFTAGPGQGDLPGMLRRLAALEAQMAVAMRRVATTTVDERLCKLETRTSEADRRSMQASLETTETENRLILEVVNLNARLDGLPEQLGKAERALLDRIEVLEAPGPGPTPAQVQAQFQAVAERLGGLEAKLTTVICPDCKGTGEVWWSKEKMVTRCAMCHGTGRVPEPAPGPTAAEVEAKLQEVVQAAVGELPWLNAQQPADPVTPTVACPVCKGTGRVPLGNPGGLGILPADVACRQCRGTGRVPA